MERAHRMWNLFTPAAQRNIAFALVVVAAFQWAPPSRSGCPTSCRLPIHRQPSQPRRSRQPTAVPRSSRRAVRPTMGDT